jgi:hypothetical protein
VRFGIAATSKVSRSRLMRVTLGMAALVREHNCGTQTNGPHVYRMARNGRRRTSAPPMRQPAVTADRIDYWLRRDVAPCLPQSNVNPARDRRAALMVIGRLLRDQYNAQATPVPPQLAALVEKLKNAETLGTLNRYSHSDEWNRQTGSSSRKPSGLAPGRLCAS